MEHFLLTACCTENGFSEYHSSPVHLHTQTHTPQPQLNISKGNFDTVLIYPWIILIQWVVRHLGCTCIFKNNLIKIIKMYSPLNHRSKLLCYLNLYAFV